MMSDKLVMVCGSRSIIQSKAVRGYLLENMFGRFFGWQLIYGDAPGVDSMVAQFCHDYEIHSFSYGKLQHRFENMDSPFVRLVTLPMKSYQERDDFILGMVSHVIAIWDGVSPGTERIIKISRQREKWIKVYA